jgi:hypothetical protein
MILGSLNFYGRSAFFSQDNWRNSPARWIAALVLLAASSANAAITVNKNFV